MKKITVSVSFDDEKLSALKMYLEQRGQSVESELEKIEGIGKQKRIALLKHFKTMKALRGATVDEIARVQGIGKSAAEKIYNALREN